MSAPLPAGMAFSHERSVVRTQFARAATLSSAGAVAPPLRRIVRALLKFL